jgi:hypothetical protein
VKPNHTPRARSPPTRGRCFVGALASLRTESRILGLRFIRRWGPHRIVYHLGMPRSTVQAVLHRYRMPLLRNLNEATGVDGGQLTAASLRVRHTRGSGARRPQEARIRGGGRHRKLGRTIGNHNNQKQARKTPRRGCAFLHHAVDDHSRVAYSEILDDEHKETAAALWVSVRTYFAGHRITAKGSCSTTHHVMAQNYSPKPSAQTSPTRGPAPTGRRPTKGKETQPHPKPGMGLRPDLPHRRGTRGDLPSLVHLYNQHRPHTGIGGKSPIERLSVHKLQVKNSWARRTRNWPTGGNAPAQLLSVPRFAPLALDRNTSLIPGTDNHSVVSRQSLR